ncbi:glyoxalase [Rhizobium sp. P38BS-XIX]|uniref:glyoxalase n=1 Tax=Rhizobium sp. P38BS-XIX TaxID=2726740 RepID=UPI001457262A|nr:glyoxalase [Rhizobium sp. P38BS-XIX]NLS00040.1 glyoxalase [Rhizobium sp. P38BS-XIX]
MPLTSSGLKILTVAVAAILPTFATISQAASNAPAVGAQYDTSHVYVPVAETDAFAASFVATFGGASTKQIVATVTPTPSSTTSQLIQTPVGTISLFGFKTPIPYPFGQERTGYLVTDLDQSIREARKAGASVIVEAFPDPIGRDAIIQWPGGVNMQLYWHTKAPNYPKLDTIPENRIYVSKDSANAFIQDFLRFSHGKIVADDKQAPGVEIGRPSDTFRRVRITSDFGKMSLLVTDGHLPYPYGHETTGYEVTNLEETISKATTAGATLLVQPYTSDQRRAAIVQFPGGYIAEIHSAGASQ